MTEIYFIYEGAQRKLISQNWWFELPKFPWKQGEIPCQEHCPFILDRCNGITDIHRIPQTSYNALCYDVISLGLKLGVLWFLVTTHTKTHQKNCIYYFEAPFSFLGLFHLHAQTAVDAGDICPWQTTVEKLWIPQAWACCRNKNGADSGTPLYICE